MGQGAQRGAPGLWAMDFLFCMRPGGYKCEGPGGGGGTKEFCQLCASAQTDPVATGSSASVHQTNFSTSWPPPRARPGTAWLSSNCMRHRSQLCGKRWKSRLKLGNPAAGSPERHGGLHATSTRTRTAPWGSRRSRAPAKWLAHRHAHTHTHTCALLPLCIRTHLNSQPHTP